jgi:hypothetical protein
VAEVAVSELKFRNELNNEKTWQSWYDAFENMLSAFPGVDGTPLVCVIRKILNRTATTLALRSVLLVHLSPVPSLKLML